MQQIIALLGRRAFLKTGGYLVVERSAHDALPELPANCELVRSNRYGETIVDFICYFFPRNPIFFFEFFYFFNEIFIFFGKIFVVRDFVAICRHCRAYYLGNFYNHLL